MQSQWYLFMFNKKRASIVHVSQSICKSKIYNLDVVKYDAFHLMLSKKSVVLIAYKNSLQSTVENS